MNISMVLDTSEAFVSFLQMALCFGTSPGRYPWAMEYVIFNGVHGLRSTQRLSLYKYFNASF